MVASACRFSFERFRLVLIFGAQRRQCFAGVVVDGALSVNFQPARGGQHFAFGLEFVRADLADARRDIEFRRREKNGDETPRDHVVNFRLRVIEILRFRSRRDDGKVIADLRVVEDALVRPHPIIALSAFCAWIAEVAGKIAQSFFHHRQVIFRQRARIGPRIGQHFVLLVKGLRDLQRALRRETETAIRFALQRGQIVKARRDLRAGFLLFGNIRERMTLARRNHRLGGRLVPDAIDPVVLVARSS